MTQDSFTLTGFWHALCLNPDGSIAWVERVHNAIVDQGLTDLLSVYFAGGSQKTNWYIGWIDSATFSEVSGGDTMGSHAGWTENTNYSEPTRAQWSPSVNSGVASNQVAAPFTGSVGTTIQGVFVTSSNSKGGTSGVLWSTALFGIARAVAAGQVVRLVYQLTAAGGG